MLDLMEFRTYDDGRCAFNPTHIIGWTQYQKTLEVQTRDLNDHLRSHSLHTDELDRVRGLTVRPENQVDQPPIMSMIIIDFDFVVVLLEG